MNKRIQSRWCWYLEVKGAWDGPEDLWCYSAACNKWRDLKSNIETTKVLCFAQETMSQKKTNSLTQPRSDLVWLDSAGGGQKWASKTSKDALDKPSKRRWLDSGSQEYLRSINRHQYMVCPCLTHYATIYAKKYLMEEILPLWMAASDLSVSKPARKHFHLAKQTTKSLLGENLATRYWTGLISGYVTLVCVHRMDWGL